MTAVRPELPPEVPLPAPEPNAVFVFVCGQRQRGDDAAGFLVADALPPALRSRVTMIEDGDLDATALIGMPDDARCVIVDAVTGVAPGEVVVVPLRAIAMAAKERAEKGFGAPPHSSHSMPIEGTLALVALLMGAPIEGTFVGVGVEQCAFGEPPSAPVQAAIPRAVREVVAAIERHIDETRMLATPPDEAGPC